MKRLTRICIVLLPLALASCEWLAGIRDLEGQKDAASGNVAPQPSDAAPPFETAAPAPDGSLVLVDSGLGPTVLNRRLALGSTHSCVVRGDGKVYCWGGNASGQLVTGPTSQPEARVIAGVNDVLSLVAGATHTCALDKRRHVLCWGKNDNGQLGGKPDANGIVDVALDEKAALQIAAGVRHTCALVGIGSVRCWGDNAFGQLGNGTKDDAPKSIVPIGLENNVASVFAGGFYSCAVKTNDSMTCWGDNTYGQLGDRTTKTTRPTPINVRDLDGPVRDVALGQSTTCAITLGGGLVCWGRNRIVGETAIPFGLVVPFPGSPVDVSSAAARGDAGTSPPLLSGVAVGTTHACARSLAENPLCWGSNAKAQLGQEPDGGQLSGYNDVPGLAGVVKEIAVGLGHSCALAPNDEIYCWGQNDQGQLGAPASPFRAKADRVRFAQ